MSLAKTAEVKFTLGKLVIVMVKFTSMRARTLLLSLVVCFLLSKTTQQTDPYAVNHDQVSQPSAPTLDHPVVLNSTITHAHNPENVSKLASYVSRPLKSA